MQWLVASRYEFVHHKWTRCSAVAEKAPWILVAYYANWSYANFFYRAMLCMRGTSHGPVSVCVCVCLSVCLSVCHNSEFY